MDQNNNNNTVTANEVWNLPISREEWEEIMEYESVMEMAETMRLVYEEEEREHEERMREKPSHNYRDYSSLDQMDPHDYEEESDYLD